MDFAASQRRSKAEPWPPNCGRATLPPVIQALTFDNIFRDVTPHPTSSPHVQLQTHLDRDQVLRSSASNQLSPPSGTPTITIATLEQSPLTLRTAHPATRESQIESSAVGQEDANRTNIDTETCCSVNNRPSCKNYLTVELGDSPQEASLSHHHHHDSSVSLIKDDTFRASAPPRKRRPSLLDSSSQSNRNRTTQSKAARNVLISPRSQGSTVGARSAASSHRSAKSGRSSTPLDRTRPPQEKDLARQRTQYTGPGFASLPPALARSPTSRLLTQKSQFLDDSDSENKPPHNCDRIDHTASSVSSSTVTPLSQADRPFSQSTKSSTLQSIPESQFQLTSTSKDTSQLPVSSRSGTPAVTPKRVDQRKLLFRRLFGGDTPRTTTTFSPAASPSATNCAKSLRREVSSTAAAADSCREQKVAHSESAVEPERKTFGRRALSIIGIGNEARKTTNNFDSVSEQIGGNTPEKKTIFKRISLRSKRSPTRLETNQSPNSNLFHRLKSTLDHYSSAHNGTMGNTIPNCCGGRPETAAKEAAKDDDTTRNFLTAQGGQTDLDKFDRAYAEDDIGTLVALVSSKEAFEQPLEENLHPWAATPRSVGALATTQLAALASVEDTAVKERLRVAGAIPILVEQLSSPQEDRRDAALVALSFLSIDYARACMDMFEAGIFAPLIELLKSPKTGVRAAAAQTARNIYVLEVRYRRAFRDAGGCQPLVDLLDLPSGKYDPSMLDIQLEAVYHIDDFIMFNGEEVSDCIAAIKVCNTARKLEQLQNVDQEDLREAARLLFLRVAE